MALKEIEIDVNGMTHTVQVNDADSNAAPLAQRLEERAKPAPETKARTPRNKAAKPAADKAASVSVPDAGGVEDASDPSASE